MTSYYVPSLIKNWGDNISSLWVAELLSKLNPRAEIILDDSYYEFGRSSEPAHSSDWIEIPWASIDRMALKSATDRFDRIVATHHRHCLKTNKSNALTYEAAAHKLTYFDAHGMCFRMISENRYPTFLPKERLLESFDKLKLPDEFVVIHLSGRENDGRIQSSSQQYIRNNIEKIKKFAGARAIITLGESIPTDLIESIDCKDEPGWVKLYIMYKSFGCMCSLSGFTSIGSMYKKRVNCPLVNAPSIASFNMGPPNICYSNYSFINDGTVNALYAAILFGKIPNAIGKSYYEKRCHHKQQWCQYETFNWIGNGNKQFDHTMFFDEIENCPVPLGTVFKFDGMPNREFTFMNDDEMLSMPIMTWSCKKPSDEELIK